MAKNIIESVILANETIVLNNPNGVATALREKAGYTGRTNTDELEKKLLQLYVLSPVRWSQVIRSVPFNSSVYNDSTSANRQLQLKQTIHRLGGPDYSTAKVDWGNLWGNFSSLLTGQTETNPSETVEEPVPVPAGAWIALTVIGLSIAGLAIYATRGTA